MDELLELELEELFELEFEELLELELEPPELELEPPELEFEPPELELELEFDEPLEFELDELLELEFDEPFELELDELLELELDDPLELEFDELLELEFDDPFELELEEPFELELDEPLDELFWANSIGFWPLGRSAPWVWRRGRAVLRAKLLMPPCSMVSGADALAPPVAPVNVASTKASAVPSPRPFFIVFSVLFKSLSRNAGDNEGNAALFPIRRNYKSNISGFLPVSYHRDRSGPAP